MASTALAVVREAHDSFNRREFDRLVALWGDDALWKPLFGPGGLEGNRYVGREGVQRWLASIWESWRQLETPT